MDKPLLLIVEDEAPLREALVETLSQDFKVLSAINGELGLNLAINSQPDLIILDAMMPIMGGLDMLTALRSNKVWGTEAKVLLLTNVGNIESSEKINSDPNVTVLIKSNVQLEDVLKKIREILKS